MKVLVLWRFLSTQIGSLCKQWFAVKQEGEVRDYRRRFTELVVPLENVAEEIAMGKFINRLKPEIRVEI